MGNGKAGSDAEGTTAVEDADIALSTAVSAERKNPWVKALGTLGELGDQPQLTTLSACTLAYGLLSGRGRVAVAGANMLLSLGAATAMKSIVKNTVSRTRPNVLLDEGHYEIRALGPDEGPWHSFPSGHTAGSVAVARALARSCPEAALPAYAAAAAIAGVQLPTAHHFASDIIAGIAIGLAADALVERATRLALSSLPVPPASDDAEGAGPQLG
jgi:membrane-associated phospholipid phosphatase